MSLVFGVKNILCVHKAEFKTLQLCFLIKDFTYHLQYPKIY